MNRVCHITCHNTNTFAHTTGGFKTSRGARGAGCEARASKVRFFFSFLVYLLINSTGLPLRLPHHYDNEHHLNMSTTSTCQDGTPTTTSNTHQHHLDVSSMSTHQDGNPTAQKKGPNDGINCRLGLDMPTRCAASPQQPQNTTLDHERGLETCLEPLQVFFFPFFNCFLDILTN